ncbi:MAG TPA: hypothetical protein VF478_04605 [Anaerolineae bacterium]
MFNADLSRLRQVSLNEWQQWPLSQKFVEQAASLIGAQFEILARAPGEKS